jgi:hypothetical protein
VTVEYLEDLKARLTLLDYAIRSLERYMDPTPMPSRRRRGRRTMPLAERQQVSERMAAYWAERRAQRD